MERVKVLIIDDEVEFCRTVKIYVEKTGQYEVLMAHNGATGLAMARDRKPDVILLDIMMPGMSGSEVGETLREDPSTSKIPIIFITAVISKDEQKNTTEFTSDPIIAKPIQAKELITTIEQVLKVSKK